MNVTLKEWQAIDAKAKAAREALQALDAQLNETLLAHMHDADVMKFITTIQDRLSDGLFVAGSLRLQSEWFGGDSSDANNHGLREPNALSIAGHIPHAIQGTRGLSPA